MKTNNYLIISLALFLSFVFSACSKDRVGLNEPVTDPIATDYSKAEHWLSLPAAIKTVDVFYLYPTSWARVDSAEPYICAIDNPLMLKYSKFSFGRQATAFETFANLYAPYYRQDDAVYILSLPPEEQAKIVGGIPKTDAIAAFDYYIKHFNNGRPFILAGHSQGSVVLGFILSEYMKANPDVYSRMIAAYVIGNSVTTGYLAQNPHLKFAQGPDDTGVIISYNTESPDVVPGTNGMVLPGAISINPINWKRDETKAAAAENLGSIAINKDGSAVLDSEGKIVPVMNFADARVDLAKGVVVCSTVDVNKYAPGNVLFVKGTFHSLDIPFYYFNLRQNAENRAKKFLNR